MLDRYLVPRLKAPLGAMVSRLDAAGWRADQITWLGFAVGVLAVLALVFQAYGLALVGLILNRLADGVDGELARLQGPTDRGAFLDIALDFAFYALFPLGFALGNPEVALPAAVLICSFVGTGSSFLAFASQAEKRGIQHPDFGYKGLYYLNGLAEGTETIACFVLMCLWPAYFAEIAYVFAAVCFLTAANRIWAGWRSL